MPPPSSVCSSSPSCQRPCRDEPTGGMLGGTEYIFLLKEKDLFHWVPPTALPGIDFFIVTSHRSGLRTTSEGGQPPSDMATLPGTPGRVKPLNWLRKEITGVSAPVPSFPLTAVLHTLDVFSPCGHLFVKWDPCFCLLSLDVCGDSLQSQSHPHCEMSYR